MVTVMIIAILAIFLGLYIDLPVGGVGDCRRRDLPAKIREEVNDALYDFKSRVRREPSNEEIREIVLKVVDEIIEKLKKGNKNADKKG